MRAEKIAAACGVPTIDIFVDESTPMFVKRWAPHGPGPVGIVRTFEIDDRVASEALEQRTPDSAFSLEGTDPKLKINSEKGLQQTIEIFNELLEKIGRA